MNIKKELTIPEECSGLRFDQALSQLLPEYSREQCKTWIQKGEALLDNQKVRPRQRVQPHQTVTVQTQLTLKTYWGAQAIDIEVIDEDEHLLIINKPPGLIVHPGAGNPDKTLVNALLHYEPDLALLPRAGLIHRLDKDTSGILLVAKTPSSYTQLTQSMQARCIKREYRALVCGVLLSGSTIDQPIGRHPRARTKMAVVPDGKPAITHYRILARYQDYTYLKVQLDTGRTHQIRVHMAYINHPIVGDKTYNRYTLKKPLKAVDRPMLHAYQLTLIHPYTQSEVTYTVPIPDDFQMIVKLLGGDKGTVTR